VFIQENRKNAVYYPDVIGYPRTAFMISSGKPELAGHYPEKRKKGDRMI
jgi:hypothetical protein